MFQLTTATKARLQLRNKRIKLGQKDSKDGVIVDYMVLMPNTFLDVLDPSGGLRHALYRQASAAETMKRPKQPGLEGIDGATDTPELTEAGKAIGTMPWVQEQTGCTFTIDYGAGGKSNLVLKDGTNKTLKVTLQEGGSIKIYGQLTAATDYLSAEQFGKLHRLHQSDPKITLEGPKLEQQDLDDEDDDKTAVAGGGTVTPLTALANADKRARSGKDAAAGA